MRVKFCTTEYGTLDSVLWLQITPSLKETAKASSKELQGCGWLESRLWHLLTMRFPCASVFPSLKCSNNSTSLTGWLWGLNKLIYANYFVSATWWTFSRRHSHIIIFISITLLLLLHLYPLLLLLPVPLTYFLSDLIFYVIFVSGLIPSRARWFYTYIITIKRRKEGEGERREERKREREEEKGRIVYGISQGRTFTYHLFKVTHSLTFLSKPSGLLGRRECDPLKHRTLPPGTSLLSLATAPCLCLSSEATLDVYLVTLPSLIDQEFCPTLRIILQQALGSHHPSELACDIEQRHRHHLSILVKALPSQEAHWPPLRF